MMGCHKVMVLRSYLVNTYSMHCAVNSVRYETPFFILPPCPLQLKEKEDKAAKDPSTERLVSVLAARSSSAKHRLCATCTYMYIVVIGSSQLIMNTLSCVALNIGYRLMDL